MCAKVEQKHEIKEERVKKKSKVLLFPNKEEEDMNCDCKIDCFDVTSKLFAKKIAFIWKSQGKSLSLQAERN